MPKSSLSLPLSLALSPGGQLYISPHPDNNELLGAPNAHPGIHPNGHKIRSLFSSYPADRRSISSDLLHLGILDIDPSLSPSLIFWQKVSRLFVNRLCIAASAEESPGELQVPCPSVLELEELLSIAPFMIGAEYLDIHVLENLWKDLQSAAQEQVMAFHAASDAVDTSGPVSHGHVQNFLKSHNPQWGLVGRVHFHLAENKASTDTPFAFLATYTTHLSDGGNPSTGGRPSTSAKARHLPLGRALQEYAGQKQALLSLLLPVQKAAENCLLVKEMVDSGQIFKSLMWRPQEAHQFLKAIPLIEAAGIVVRVPNWWNPKKPPRAQVSVSVGTNKAPSMGLNALLDLNVEMTLPDGETLTGEEWQTILSASENLVLIKGKWVEVDRQKLDEVLKHWKKVKAKVANEGVSFFEAMRLLAGTSSDNNAITESLPDNTMQWSTVIAGDWLADTLTQLRRPETKDYQHLMPILKKDLHATLRPYQLTGVNWLWLLYSLKLGGCLADDMGLGKTMQILSLLLLIKNHSPQNKPHLLVVPASLLSNWLTELKRFAPALRVCGIHSSLVSVNKLEIINEETLASYDLVMTTYTFLQRLEWLQKVSWDVVVLDEAQLIKNPAAKQTRCVKSLKCQVRFTLTGTPVENRLGDLWSLFDFTCPGLLGSAKSFSNYAKKVESRPPAEDQPPNEADTAKQNHFYAAIRTLVSPYILRRLKADKNIIDDLPDKTELKTFCSLSKRQITLYQQSLEELLKRLETADGIQRRGLVISYLTRFKQICNHPTQWLGHGNYDFEESGKFIRLKEICEEIAAKQEKVLIFTQFREIMPALSEFLATIFGQSGLLLHGGTPIKERGKLVKQFNADLGCPFFILSLKAGGTGLNLTKASHVIHFDRWWNPAVENQATDRAYRIGQHKNVLVHKFICRGTIEEKIDTLIDLKKDLSHQLLARESEVSLTELSNEDLIKIVSLDIHRVLEES